MLTKASTLARGYGQNRTFYVPLVMVYIHIVGRALTIIQIESDQLNREVLSGQRNIRWRVTITYHNTEIWAWVQVSCAFGSVVRTGIIRWSAG